MNQDASDWFSQAGGVREIPAVGSQPLAPRLL